MSALLKPLMAPALGAIDVLLANVAIRIQLAPSHHRLAVERYETVNQWIERYGSPLFDKVQLFYPQGSMAIGATIASKLRTDEFDIDLIAQLDVPPNTAPHAVLDLLEAAIRGDSGSRYYDMTNRCTRCIQIQYADNMHLDVTPMIRLAQLSERGGFIPHARDRFRQADDRMVTANPYGFAQWFNAATPPERDFAKVFAEQERLYEQRILLEKAETEPVPAQTAAHQKSKAVIVLQLLKRWRNIRYDKREGRRPASVVLAKLIADSANHTTMLSEELLHQSRAMLLFFETAERRGTLVEVRNPACVEDVFTDRWPASQHEQRVFLHDLRDLVAKVEQLTTDCDLTTMRSILSELFGENATAGVFEDFNKATGAAIASGNSYHVPGAGKFDLARSGAAAAATSSVASMPTPKHTNFGGA